MRSTLVSTLVLLFGLASAEPSQQQLQQQEEEALHSQRVATLPPIYIPGGEKDALGGPLVQGREHVFVRGEYTCVLGPF